MKGHPSLGFKISLVHSSDFPDSPRQAGQFSQIVANGAFSFLVWAPTCPTWSSVVPYVGWSTFYSPMVDFFGQSHRWSPGLRGHSTPIWKGSKAEAIHTWCRSEGFSSCFCVAFPCLWSVCSPEARAASSPHSRPTQLVSVLAEVA